MCMHPVILDQLLTAAEESFEDRAKMRALDLEIQDIFSGQDSDRFERMKQPLLTLWRLRETLVNELLHKYPRESARLATAFSRLRSGIKGFVDRMTLVHEQIDVG